MKITTKNPSINSNIGHHVLYMLTKFELKIQPTHEETKSKNLTGCRLDEIK
jgi:hypothetical protein